MILRIDFGTPAFDEMVKLRDAILRQPLNLKFKISDLQIEYDQIHFGYFDDEYNIAGCLILKVETKNRVKMRQVAVINKLQNKGIGKLLVQAAETYSKEFGYTEIILNARDEAIPFYVNLGYQKIGKPFKEVSIKHHKMKKVLLDN